MKRILFATLPTALLTSLLTSLLLPLTLLGQFSTDRVDFTTPPPPPPTNITGSVVGVGGQNTVFYWVIAAYPRGDSQPGGPLTINFSQPITGLSATNFNRIRWSHASGATSYTVIRNTTNSNPLSSGTCAACRIATGLTSPQFDDVGGATGSFSISTIPGVTGYLVLDNKSFTLPRFTLSPYGLGADSFIVTGSETDGIYNVKDYGAVCDNVTDDTVAIQAAVDAAAGKGTVLLTGPSLCVISSTIELPSNTDLSGTGWNTGIRGNWNDTSGGTAYINNEAPLSSTGNTNITVRNFSLEGGIDGTPQNPAMGFTIGVNLSSVQDVLVENMRFYRIPSMSLRFLGSRRFSAINNFIQESGRDGIQVHFIEATDTTEIVPSDGVISDNIIYRVGDDAISIRSSGPSSHNTTARLPRFTVSGNVIRGWDSVQTHAAGSGILAEGVEDLVIDGNTISLTPAPAIRVAQDIQAGSSEFSARNFVVSNNTISGVASVNLGPSGNDDSISIEGSTYAVITGNTIRSGVGKGIRVIAFGSFGETEDVIVSNNVVEGMLGATSIEYAYTAETDTAAHMNRVTFKDNKAYNNNGGGLLVNLADATLVEGNEFYDNGNAQSSATDINASGLTFLPGAGAATIVIRNNSLYDTRGVSAQQTYGITFSGTASANAVIDNNDIHGNETGQLNLATLPTVLRQTGNRLALANTQFVSIGRIGINEEDPDGELHIKRAGAPRIFLENTSGTVAGFGLRVNNSDQLVTGIIGSTDLLATTANGGLTFLNGVALGSLGTPANGTLRYCTDCLRGSAPCTASSTGSFAKRENGAWNCD